MYILIDLILIGAVAGVLSGLLGIGGGVVVVPALVCIFQHGLQHVVPQHLMMQMAVASSLMSILLTSIAATHSHYLKHKTSVRGDIWIKWVVGLFFGAIIGAIAASMLNPIILRDAFAFFLLGVVIKFLTEKRWPSVVLPLKKSLLFFMGVIIGATSGLLGVGGGILMVPALLSLGCTMPESAATSSASTVPLALVGGISFMFTGWLHGIAVPWSTGYIYWPAVWVIGITGIVFAPLGVKLAYVIPVLWLKRLFILLLLVISIQILV